MQDIKKTRGNAVVSWTGGKDGCYSCCQAMRAGWRITHLLHFRNLKRRGSHEIHPEVIQAQADALGIPLIQRDFSSYEEEFKTVIRELRMKGVEIDGAVFGHIATHGMLVDRLCHELDLELIMPLWNEDSEKILMEIIDSGFEVSVVSAKRSLLGEEWIGRKIDTDFIRHLHRWNESIDPCGENGEFHTLVTDGPIFHQKMVITASETLVHEGYWIFNITGVALVDKP